MLTISAATALVALATAASALGCSCAYPSDDELRELYADAEGALVGRAVARRELDFSTAETTFEVEEDFKRNLGDRVVVRSAASGASCGLEVAQGERIGLFLWREEGEWRSNLCNEVEPERLRKAAQRDLPPPTGERPPALIAGGNLGAPRVVGFDAQGRVAGYGDGEGMTDMLAPCPGGRQVAEYGWNGRGEFVGFRDATTLAPGDETRLDLRGLDGQYPQGFACRGGDRPAAYLFTSDGDEPDSKLVRIRDGKVAVLHRGHAVAAAFGDAAAYLYDVPRRRLIAVDLESGRVTEVRRKVPKLAPLEVSPDGRSLLAHGYTGSDPTYYRMRGLSVVPLSPRGRRHSLTFGRPRDAAAMWAGAGTVALFARSETVLFDARLERRRRLPRLAGTLALRGDIAYGLDKGALRSLDLASGKRAKLSEFPVVDPLPLVSTAGQATAADTGRTRSCFGAGPRPEPAG